jgi:hypothetical protein
VSRLYQLDCFERVLRGEEGYRDLLLSSADYVRDDLM